MWKTTDDFKAAKFYAFANCRWLEASCFWAVCACMCVHVFVFLKSCKHDISRMYHWIAFKFGGGANINTTMN